MRQVHLLRVSDEKGMEEEEEWKIISVQGGGLNIAGEYSRIARQD